jgi:hypothetical protein
MAIVRTIIRIPSQDSQYSIPGEYTAAQIQNMYSAQIQGIASMTSTVEDATGPTGEERIITFAARSGNKG